MKIDKFADAFKRFEEVVDTRYIHSFTQLKLSFERWAGEKWKDTPKQNEALKHEARKIGIPVREEYKRPKYRYVRVPKRCTWTFERITVRGKLQVRYRDKKTGRFIRKPRKRMMLG